MQLDALALCVWFPLQPFTPSDQLLIVLVEQFWIDFLCLPLACATGGKVVSFLLNSFPLQVDLCKLASHWMLFAVM